MLREITDQEIELGSSFIPNFLFETYFILLLSYSYKYKWCQE